MVPAGIRREAKSVHERYGLDKLTLVPNADRLADHREDEEVMWYSGLGLLVTWASVSDRTKLDGIERYLGDYYAPLVEWSGARFPDVDPVDLAVRRRWTYILDGLYDGRSVSGGGGRGTAPAIGEPRVVRCPRPAQRRVRRHAFQIDRCRKVAHEDDVQSDLPRGPYTIRGTARDTVYLNSIDRRTRRVHGTVL